MKHQKWFFHDLFSRCITLEYVGLQGVTGGYKGLQGVTGGYWHSNLKKSQTFDQNDGLTPLEKFHFCIFRTQLFL